MGGERRSLGLGGPHPAVESSSAPARGGGRRDGPLLGASSRHPLSVYLSRTSPVKHRAGPRLCFRPPRRPGPRVRIRTRITIRTRIARSRQRRPLPVLFRFRSELHDCETAVDETTPPCQAKAQRALDAHRSANLRAHRCLRSRGTACPRARSIPYRLFPRSGARRCSLWPHARPGRRGLRGRAFGEWQCGDRGECRVPPYPPRAVVWG